MFDKQVFPRGLKGAVSAYRFMYETDKWAVILQFPMALLRAMQPYLTLFVTGYILNGFVTGAEFAQLLRVALGFIALRFVLERTERFIHKIFRVREGDAVERMYLEKAKKYMHVDYELLDGPAIKEINDRIQRDNNWGGGFYAMSYYLYYALDGVFGFIVGLVMLVPFFIHSGAGGVTLLMVGLMGFALLSVWINMRFFMAKQHKLLDGGFMDRKHITHLWQIIGYPMSQLLKTARIYSAAPVFKHHMDADIPHDNAFGRKFTQYAVGSAFMNSFSGGVLLIGAYLFVVARAVAGVIPIGGVVLYAGTIHQLANRFFDMTNYYARLVDQTNKVQSMLAFMEMPTKQALGTLPIEKRRDGEYEIEFRNVSFQYPGSTRYALKNFNLKLHIGQKLAIVGMNGSGKTTMIKLLTRLYDPTEGEITLNGLDVRKYDLREYLSIFSVVFQDFKIFSFTLADNIACDEGGNASISQNGSAPAILNALSRVGLSDRVAVMPNGLQTYMYNDYDEGTQISGGEAQKIALARALYKNAPFIVLDEPTAALDPIAEYEIYTAFNEIVGDKTAIYISHRLSSCRFCDDIAVFHEGQIIQRGNHDSLLSDSSGKYHALWHAQAQYYTAD